MFRFNLLEYQLGVGVERKVLILFRKGQDGGENMQRGK